MTGIGNHAALRMCAIALVTITVPHPCAGGDRPVHRVALENDRARAHVILYPPGSVTPRHAHRWPRVVVVIEGGRLEIRDGEVRTLEIEPGQVVWRPAEEHVIANVGTTPIRVVEIDLLDPPAGDAPGTEP